MYKSGTVGKDSITSPFDEHFSSSRVCLNFILAMTDIQEDPEDHGLDDFS